MGNAIKAFFDWLARVEQTFSYDPVFELELRVHSLEMALAESRSSQEQAEVQ